ncbi:1,4-dihydroxy-6-naphthoate synthase [Paenalkalicoccus suaedae]|uniref:1,4-dihydroxy-6-naphtoate synthase n=1 Tax=Paenalkalicoccus suaedae TaxID=2592382 RepID=A0A859FCX0_9BACI|nr:1,4-dihydroxy-6-naphthoate synthase [Paenalkalicoccus suaedae]QKS70105.1 1,4-dihydroxy-6-naphthoate synthase [Paenalkalicoccus suaedae]
MKIAFSPCPNDTFIFHALVHGKVDGAPKMEVTYADIDKTNHWAAENRGPEVMKISYAALPWVLDNYQLIPCGGALGRGCGPLVLINGEKSFDDLKGKRIAVPSDRSTAYLLFRLWLRQQVPDHGSEIIVMSFDDIMPAVQSGEVDAGLVIHEARFTYQNYGLSKLVDLGDWWEQDTGTPIPLGAIIARKDVDAKQLEEWIKASLSYAYENPSESNDYIMEYAQEMSADVARQHIDLYVNEFSMDLGDTGRKAVESLLVRAAAEGLLPKVEVEELWSVK